MARAYHSDEEEDFCKVVDCLSPDEVHGQETSNCHQHSLIDNDDHETRTTHGDMQHEKRNIGHERENITSSRQYSTKSDGLDHRPHFKKHSLGGNLHCTERAILNRTGCRRRPVSNDAYSTPQEIKTTDVNGRHRSDFSTEIRQQRGNSDLSDYNELRRQTESHTSTDVHTNFKRKPEVTLQKLVELSKYNEDPDDLLLEFAEILSGFREILDNEIKPEWLYYILKILSDVVASSLKRNLIELLVRIEEKLLHRLGEALGEICIRSTLYSCIWDNQTSLHNTCFMILKILQVLAQTLTSTVGKCKHVLILIKEIQSDLLVEDTTLSKEVEDMEGVVSAVVEELDSNCPRTSTKATMHRYCQETGLPEDFRELGILPTVQDMQNDENPFLRAIIPKGKYDSLDSYLDIQFHLLREDFINPLRKGILEYIESLYDLNQTRRIREIRIYKNVQIIGPVCKNEETNHLIYFDTSELKGVDWTVCRRLLYGSLLCLSCDNFSTITYATVTDRTVEELHRGCVRVRFEALPAPSGSTKFLMAESTAYFEAFKHVLEGLQSVDSSLPFQRYILDCNPVIKPPSYLLGVGVPAYNFTCVLPKQSQKECFTDVPILNTVRWPTPEDLNLDSSQYEALQLALTKELAIIQGPPGTGKTYIGLQIAKLLLENKEYWMNSVRGSSISRVRGSPILVVCYTNHALDQFLEGMLHFCKGSIVRIGGRCKNKALEPYILRNLKPQKMVFSRYMKNVRDAKRCCEQRVHEISSLLKGTFTELQSYSILNEHMTVEQMEAFETNMTDDEHLMTDWLALPPSPIMQTYRISKNEGARRLWVAHILGRVEKMIEHDRKLVSDICTIDLYTRAKLYKAWLMELEPPSNTRTPLHRKRTSLPKAMLRMSKTKIISPNNMLPYIKSRHTRFQLKVFRHVSDFEAWLAIDGSDYSTSAIEYIYTEIIDETHVFKSMDGITEERELDADDDSYVFEYNGDEMSEGTEVNTKRDWVWHWNATNEWEKIKVITKEARELTDEVAKSIVNVWSASKADRRSLYWYWVGKYRENLNQEVKESEKKYSKKAAALAELKDRETRDIVSSKNVIGMTTTGAAKNRKLLQSIQPAIVIVEEAAEVLESHIITSLNAKCKHMVLIGDHKQLRPSTTVYHLAKQYHLDISFFERMIMNDMPCVTLSEQHRMRTEISVLLKNKYLYPNLRDHKDVSEYENVHGIDSDVFFIEHSEPEMHHVDSTSYRNPHEAKFTAQLFKYLLKQGYANSQITVLTPYIGQATLLRREMDKSGISDVYITVVDNFQGEENDIILLSLVRSSGTLKNKNPIGFLAIENRICVSLSRAKKGLYVIGNFSLMKKYSRLWNHNVCLLATKERVGPELILRCQNHPQTVIKASKPEDFDQAPEGGCMEPCLAILKCDHVCPIKICHVIDHESILCKEPCERIFPECRHRCKKACFEICEPCETQVEKVVSYCGHKADMPCHLDPNEWNCYKSCGFELQCGHECERNCYACHKINEHENKCKKRVSKQLRCGHAVDVHCFQDPLSVVCTYPCSVTLSCGHVAEIKCSQDPQTAVCREPCSAELLCGHICSGSCASCFRSKIHQQCETTCRKPLPCGHKCSYRCSDYCPPCNLPCEWICSHGAKCGKKCSENCDPCFENCYYKCAHSRCTKLCYEICDYVPCNKKCNKKLPCGHTCIGLCGELCVCSEFCSEKKNKMYRQSKQGIVYFKIPNCGCIIPQMVLDKHMSGSSYTDDELVKRCPVCRNPMSSFNKRYSNTMKLIWEDVFCKYKSIKPSEKEKTRRAGALCRRVFLLRDIGLCESDATLLNDRLRICTIDTLTVLEKTVNLLQELLTVCRCLSIGSEPKLNEIKQIILKERRCGTNQLWEEIRREIKRIGSNSQMKISARKQRKLPSIIALKKKKYGIVRI